MHQTFSKRGRSCLDMRQAITLVEVVAGLVLMGTLLSGLLIAASRLHRQHQAALDKLAAVSHLDRLASEFFRSGFPALNERGPIETANHLVWQFEGRPADVSPHLFTLGRLSIVRRDAPSQGGAEKILASIELFVDNQSIGTRR